MTQVMFIVVVIAVSYGSGLLIAYLVSKHWQKQAKQMVDRLNQ